MAVRGIDRELIETHVKSVIQAWTGYDDFHVIIPELQSNQPAPSRPFISFLVGTPTGQTTKLEESSANGLEVWRLEITGGLDGTYTVNMNGVAFPVVAVALSAAAIRDLLVTALSADTTVAVVATGTITASIDISSEVPGRKSLITATSTGSPITTDLLRGNRVRCGFKQVEVMLSIRCWGIVGSLTPTAKDSGSAVAEELEATFLSRDDTQAMRDAGVVPNRARVNEENIEVNGDAETIGLLEVVLRVQLFHASSGGSVESASVEVA